MPKVPTELRLAPSLTLPIDAVTQRFGFIGRIGSGKTYAATKLLELMLDIGAQVVALDPVGTCYGLRVDGTGAGYPIPVFGGLHGDIPLEATAGAMMADLIVDRGLSCVLDVSQFPTDKEKARFAADFADRFYFRKKAKPSAVFLFLEECQEFIPQNPQRGEELMLHHFTRMAKLGRNFGIGLGLGSQRPQEVNKKVLNLTECMFIFQLRGAHERKAMRDWITAKDADAAILDEMPKLPVGTAIVDSPQWLKVSDRVRVYAKRSADVSATPKVGDVSVATKPLTPVDLEALRTEMAETVERTKAEDPKALQQRIRELERQVTSASVAVDDDALQQAYREGVREGERRMALEVQERQQATNRAHLEYLRVAGEALDLMKQDLVERPAREDPRPVATPEIEQKMPEYGLKHMLRVQTVPVERLREVYRGMAQRHAESTPPSTEGLMPSEQKILDAIALMEQIGWPTDRQKLAFFAGYSVGGRFNRLVGQLNTRGFVTYPGDGVVALTEDGRAHANPDAAPVRSRADLHALWLSKLEPSEAKILSALIEAHPQAVPRSQLASMTDYVVGGRFNRLVGHLRTLGAVDYPGDGYVRASDNLYPKGLR